jgi:acyl-CoA reductase-like NAD-dependent aldehyde dehydrogenase
MGEWPRASVAHRIQCVQKFTAELQKRRDEIVKILMWEICKVPYFILFCFSNLANIY